jgi:CSLREA domain-containing protein
MSLPSCRGVLLACLFAVSVAFAQHAAAEVVFTVNSLADQIDDDTSDGICHTAAGTCTLRAAVMSANKASGAGAKIMLPAGLYTLARPATGVDGDDSGDLNLTAPASGTPVITIVGAGAAVTIIDANQIDRVLNVAANRTASISGITLRNGVATQLGGGIYNGGSLTVTDSVISGNSAIERGGGICNAGTLTLTRTTVDSNVLTSPTSSGGGGVYTEGNAQIDQSTISRNTALDGGGLFILAAATSVTNSTIAYNNAYTNGGGIYNQHAINVYNSTIVGNQADADADQTGGVGGGIYFDALFGTAFNLRNTIVAANYLSGAPVYDDCDGSFGLYGRNVFGTTNGCTFGGTGSYFVIASLYELGNLQNNGGSTDTIALLPPSSMIDGGDPIGGCVDQNGVTLATDQRGKPRAVGARCDLGAFEYQDELFANGFD